MRYLLTISALILFHIGVAAQSNFTVDANFMTRGEVRKGGLPVSDNVSEANSFAAFIVERTMLSLDYQTGGLDARVTAQHSGTWGSNEGGIFNVYEAWANLKSQNGFFVRLGRQNISYDDQRIFGSDDWSMTGRSHDALKAGYEGHGHKVHIMGAYNQDAANMSGGTFYSGGLQPYKSMEALWYHYDIPKVPAGASLVFMNIGMQGGEKGDGETNWSQQLYGTFISYRPKFGEFEGSYYRQGGYEEHGIPISAWMASLKASVKINPGLSLTGGYDYLSGDKDFAVPPEGMIGMPRHEVIRGFSSINGSHHKFYGAMDFFYVTAYYGGFTPGLQNLYARGNWTPWEKVNLDLSYHYLATATELTDASKSLGHEIELSASYGFLKYAKLSLGYSFMMGTETMVRLKRSTDNRHLHWGWMMLTVNPNFFKTR